MPQFDGHSPGMGRHQEFAYRELHRWASFRHEAATEGVADIAAGRVEDGFDIFEVAIRDGYDDGGAYWGCGTPLWCLRGDGTQIFLRAEDAVEAVAAFRAHLGPAFSEIHARLAEIEAHFDEHDEV